MQERHIVDWVDVFEVWRLNLVMMIGNCGVLEGDVPSFMNYGETENCDMFISCL